MKLLTMMGMMLLSGHGLWGMMYPGLEKLNNDQLLIQLHKDKNILSNYSSDTIQDLKIIVDSHKRDYHTLRGAAFTTWHRAKENYRQILNVQESVSTIEKIIKDRIKGNFVSLSEFKDTNQDSEVSKLLEKTEQLWAAIKGDDEFDQFVKEKLNNVKIILKDRGSQINQDEPRLPLAEHDNKSQVANRSWMDTVFTIPNAIAATVAAALVGTGIWYYHQPADNQAPKIKPTDDSLTDDADDQIEA